MAVRPASGGAAQYQLSRKGRAPQGCPAFFRGTTSSIAGNAACRIQAGHFAKCEDRCLPKGFDLQRKVEQTDSVSAGHKSALLFCDVKVLNELNTVSHPVVEYREG